MPGVIFSEPMDSRYRTALTLAGLDSSMLPDSASPFRINQAGHYTYIYCFFGERAQCSNAGMRA